MFLAEKTLKENANHHWYIAAEDNRYGPEKQFGLRKFRYFSVFENNSLVNIRDHGPFFPWTAVCHSTADTGSYGRRKGASATELDFLDANSRNASLPESVGQRRVSII